MLKWQLKWNVCARILFSMITLMIMMIFCVCLCYLVLYEFEFGFCRSDRLGRRWKWNEMYVSILGKEGGGGANSCCAPLNAKHHFPFFELTMLHMFCDEGFPPPIGMDGIITLHSHIFSSHDSSYSLFAPTITLLLANYIEKRRCLGCWCLLNGIPHLGVDGRMGYQRLSENGDGGRCRNLSSTIII